MTEPSDYPDSHSKWKTAVNTFEQAYNLDSSDVEIVDNYAYLLYRSGDYAKASKISSKAIDLNPSRSSSWGTFAQIQAALGNKNTAVAALDAAYLVSRNRQKTKEFLGWLKEASSESNPTLVAAINDSYSHHSIIDGQEINTAQYTTSSPTSSTSSQYVQPAPSNTVRYNQNSNIGKASTIDKQSATITNSEDSNIVYGLIFLVLSLGAVFGLNYMEKMKMEMENKEQIRKYFKVFPVWALVFIFVGVGLFLIKSLWLYGLSAIAIGGGAIYYWYQKPSDSEFDAILNSYIENIKRLSLSKMGFESDDLVADSVHISGVKWDPPSGVISEFKVGDDEVARYTPVNLTVLHFAPDQLLTYECTLDLFTGNPLNTSTDEYFYKDVVSVSTKTKSISKNIPKIGQIQMDAAEIFTLSTSGGTSIEVFLRDPKLIDKLRGDLPTTQAERTIQSVRKVLREKKST